jgi:hypothetical protein
VDRLVVLIGSLSSFVMLGSASPSPVNVSSTAPPAAREEPPRLSRALDGLFVARQPVRRSLMVETEPPPPLPPTAQQALADGVLIVVSIPSQEAFVFKDGAFWDSSPVSTGKPGNDTPTGEFPLLQKKKLHRSTLYDDAPMPFMQRITWDGVALHAGRVPGYPASHGCIRLPGAFAEKLYGITSFSSTVVVVTDEPVRSPEGARKLA